MMDGLHQPLLTSRVLELEPELLHLISCPLRQDASILNLLPETVGRKVIVGILRENLEHLYTLANGKAFLLADIQLLALMTVKERRNQRILFESHHLGTANHILILGALLDGVGDPGLMVQGSVVEIFDLQHIAVLRFYLVGERLMLFDNQAAVLLDYLLYPKVLIATFWQIKHY